MYHRIATPERDPWNLAVSPEHFEQHLQRIRNLGEPMPLTTFAASLGSRSQRPAIVVTFDDGYVDNLVAAAPLLAEHAVPATVFVTTGYVGSGRQFWWDDLERILLTTDKLPDDLRLTIGAADVFSSKLGAASLYAERDRTFDKAWFVHRKGEPSPRFALLRALHARLMAAEEGDRLTALAALETWAGSKSAQAPSVRCVSREELLELRDAPGIEIGAHTVTHPALPGLPISAQEEEMARSRAELEKLTGRPVATFAYPFGQHSRESIASARSVGFTCACGTREAAVDEGAGLFSLPRVKIADWDGAAFERALARWLPA